MRKKKSLIFAFYILSIILALVYVNSRDLPVWKENAMPWLIGGLIVTVLGMVAVQIDKNK